MKRISCQVGKLSYANAELYREKEQLTINLQYDGAYGMGEKYDSLNQKGKTVVNQVQEKFCFQGEKTYCTLHRLPLWHLLRHLLLIMMHIR